MSRIEVQIGANTSAFKSGLAEAKGQAREFANSVKSEFAGMFAAGAILAGIKTAVDHFGDVGDLAEKFKISAEELQRLSYAGEQSGTSMEAVAKALARIKIAMADAVQNGGQARQIFESQGIAMSDIESGAVTAERALKAVATAIANNGNEAQKTAIANAIFGAKLGPELASLLELGGAGIDSLSSKAATLSNSMVAQLKEASDAGKDLQNTMTVGFGYIAVAINWVIEGLRLFITVMVQGWGAIYSVQESTFMALKALLSGNLEEARNHAKGIKDAYQTAWDSIVDQGVKSYDKLNKAAEAPQKAGVGPTVNLEGEAAKAERLKAADELARAQAAYDKAKRDADLAEMDRQTRINELIAEKQRLTEEADAAAKANGGKDTKESLENRTAALALEKQIRSENEAANKESQAHADRLVKLDEQISSAQEKRDEAGLTRKELLAKKLSDEASLNAKAAAENDPEKARELRLKAISAGTEADNIAKELSRPAAPRAPTVDSLRAIGGGSGGIGAAVDPMLRIGQDQLAELRAIRASVSATNPKESPNLSLY